VKAVLVLVALALAAGVAEAHRCTEHGNVTVAYPAYGAGEFGLFALVESVAPGIVPNGLFYYVIHDVISGDEFALLSDDGQSTLACPDPSTPLPPKPHADDSTEQWSALAAFTLDHPTWLLCLPDHDFDVVFTDGHHENVWGDERGVVPGGAAVVYLAYGDPGEGFTWTCH